MPLLSTGFTSRFFPSAVGIGWVSFLSTEISLFKWEISCLLSFSTVFRRAITSMSWLYMEYDEALEFVNKNDTLGTYERMKKSGY